MEYEAFLATKQRRAEAVGFEPSGLNENLFEWQADIVRWACRLGRAAIFANTGLGKTIMQLDWAQQVIANTGDPVLLLCPLAVAQQTKREAAKFNVAVDVAVCREQDDVIQGINVVNYDRLHKFDPSMFSGIVLDESSILKSLDGKTRTALIESFSATPYKLCCTATPAPNDHTELGNHAEFLNVMRRSEMLAMYFTHDGSETQKWRLKRHGVKEFWRWVASWAVAVNMPSDLGYSDDGFILPSLNKHEHIVDVPDEAGPGFLFSVGVTSATGIHKEKRLTAVGRAECVAGIVAGETAEPWVIWCDTDYESDALSKAIPEAVAVKGSMPADKKETTINAFSTGEIRILISKPSLTGFGLNWQHCHHTAFVGLSYSFEKYYQAVRRLWRFGQQSEVECHIVSTEGEHVISQIVSGKEAAHEHMKAGMMEAIKGAQMENIYGAKQDAINEPPDVAEGDGWTLHRDDSCERIKSIPDGSIHFSLFSPPFASLYSYTDLPEDMGNAGDYSEFFTHFHFLCDELFRVTMPGRLCAVHSFLIPLMKSRDGVIGLRDFPGDIIRMFEAVGWVWHGRVVIPKDPLVEATRTKALRLAHKQLCKDSAMCGPGISDYVDVFRVPQENPEPIARKRGIEGYTGNGSSITGRKTDDPRTNKYSHEIWRRYAEPVWNDIDQTRVLRNYRDGRGSDDEKHICALQLDVIERCVELWTNPGDTVFSPFAGIGSEGYGALLAGRKFLGIELKRSYWKTACGNLRRAAKEYKEKNRTLFD